MVGQTVGDYTIVQKFCTIGQYLSQVKVGQTNHMGQERSNWTYCQYKGHLTHIKEIHKDILSYNKERHKDCPMNMNTRHFSSWTNTRQMDKSQFFPLYFFNRTWDNVFYVADTLSNMHGTHKNSPYGQTLRNQKNSLFFGFFFTRIVGQTGTPNIAVSDNIKILQPCL